MVDEEDYDYDEECGCRQDDCSICNTSCWYCHGEGWGIVGSDWDCNDGINGPYDGDTEKCPNCHGTGKAKDCTFW